MASTCPICEKRRAKRFCPGLPRSRWSDSKTQSICAQCCGEQREVAIDCPADCSYLIAAHRYEAERPREGQPKKPEDMPFHKVVVERRFLEDQQPLLVGLSLLLVRLAREHTDIRDPELLSALDALAQSYQTLEAGLYYEQAAATPAAQRVAAAVRQWLEQFSQEQQQKLGTSLRPVDALHALVFLRRLGQMETNGRPLSRRFLEFMRAQLPAGVVEPAATPRLILPGA
ncbi:MAG: hypothetical protein L0212_03160 [Acidobacteria bacterium]|nr:hypothetical protein [Acidobacteriota bacterium]